MNKWKNLGLAWLLVGCLSEGAQGQESLPWNHPKVLAAQQIFDDLVRAIGDGRTPPQLRLLPRHVQGRMRVAWFQPEAHTVTLEERAYDVCASLGADSLHALAWVLGHELAHCYQDHGWVGDFGNGFSDLEVGQTLRESSQYMERLLEHESQADYFGGFFGYVAGYNTLGVGPAALARIYGEYGLEEEIEGYPSLGDRQTIARRSRAEVEKLIPVFEGGRFCLLIERYEEAGRCFAYLGRTFPSREILNNAGVTRALEALDLFDPEEVGFAYPFEADASTRLRDGSKAAEQPFAESRDLRRRQLREARQWLERARSKDPAYVPALVNLAGVADLQEEREEAVFLAGRAIGLARDQGEEIGLAHALIMRGIARLHGDPTARVQARNDFEQAAQGAPALAHLNLTLLSGRPVSSGPAAAAEYLEEHEQIATLGAEDYESVIEKPDQIVSVPQVDRTQPAIDIYTRRSEAGNCLVMETRYGLFSFLETPEGYSEKSREGIRIGDDWNGMEAAYGTPDYRVAGRQGTHHVYTASRIIFRTDAQGEVRGWVVYAVE